MFVADLAEAGAESIGNADRSSNRDETCWQPGLSEAGYRAWRARRCENRLRAPAAKRWQATALQRIGQPCMMFVAGLAEAGAESIGNADRSSNPDETCRPPGLNE